MKFFATIFVISMIAVFVAANDEPEPCCWPESYQADTVEWVQGDKIYMRVKTEYTYVEDFEELSQKIEGDDATTGGVPFTVVIRQDLNKLFYVDHGSETCTIVPNPKIHGRCLPSDMKYVGTAHQGIQEVDGFVYEFADSPWYAFVTTGQQDPETKICSPITSMISNAETSYNYAQAIWVNVIAKPWEPEEFAVPEPCLIEQSSKLASSINDLPETVQKIYATLHLEEPAQE